MALGEAAVARALSVGSVTRWRRGGGTAAFIERDTEKAVVELEEHAVRSWETREANALEELESAKRRVLQVAKRISNAQQILGRPDTKPSAVYRIKVGGDLS